jgi:3-deoxy-7-phosphoheptulonate synthase
MIVHLHQHIHENQLLELSEKHQAVSFRSNGTPVLVLPSALKILPESLEPFASQFWVTDSDIQLAGKSYRTDTREVRWGNAVVGGNSGNTVVIAGPCSVESLEQIQTTAALLKELGIHTMRAGAFKPRTSPYTFQGMGLEGLQLLARMREEHGFSIITEVRDATHIEEVIAYADVIQIGAKAMYDHGILRRCGKAGKPVLLKRGFGSTLQEFVQCAEFILSGGNEQVMLCERGIRTFETKTRFTLDLCGVAYLKEYTNLPVILDPSHAMGYAYGVPDLARACVAMGVDGILIETHPQPSVAKSDASQQLDHDAFRKLYQSLRPIASAVNRKLI